MQPAHQKLSVKFKYVQEADMSLPVVGIIMGSSSDEPTMQKAGAILDQLEIPYDMTVCSAHRNPERTAEYASKAKENGRKVIIAGAGLAAALPGVIAAHTTLPVIGVPCGGGALNGVDALYAIVQMPPGVPVATVGIDNARNAAVLAAQILALSDDGVQKRLAAYKKGLGG